MVIGIIPARKGSKRLPHKNMMFLSGKPLLQYAIESAQESKILDEIVVTTDWEDCIKLAEKFGVQTIRRPDEICADKSHDYEFVKHCLEEYPYYDTFVILRPTNPFRTAKTIRNALDLWNDSVADSLRAVEKTKHHPLKSWVLPDYKTIVPYQRGKYVDGFPAFDMGTQRLGNVYCQNGCIHIGRTDNLEIFGDISGEVIVPFFTLGMEGFDINTEQDLKFAEWVMRGEP